MPTTGALALTHTTPLNPPKKPQVQLGEMATVMTERFFDSLMGEINNSGKKK
jgi:hypothetical protein